MSEVDPKSEKQQPCGNQAVIITGMHRSGTSLTTSILQKAGINIGENLYPVVKGNIRGHYEDLEFLELHQEILRAKGVNPSGWFTVKKILVPNEYISKAKNIVKSRLEREGIWGWKDPRTTLFLEFWKELLPEAKYIFVYRSPWEVVDSLFRRGTDAIFMDDPELAINMWTIYNKTLLDFYTANSKNSILVHAENLSGMAESFLDAVTNKLKIPMDKLKEPVFEISLMQKDISSSYRPILLTNFFPETLNLYEQLNMEADLPEIESTSTVSPGGTEENYKDYFLQDWLKNRSLEEEIKLCKSELSQTQSELAYLRQVIEEIEDSKFWKTRKIWLSLKQRIGY